MNRLKVDESEERLSPDERYDFSSSSASAAVEMHEVLNEVCSTEVKWPCANCHAMVSEDRCPLCHGIQVKIKNDGVQLQGAWIERVSPIIRIATTPLSLSGQKKQQDFGGQSRPLDNEFVDLDEEEEAELEQTSESSPRDENIDEEEYMERPNNPVAFLLATAESPLPKFEARLPSDDARQVLKKQSQERADRASGTEKRQRVLFAM